MGKEGTPHLQFFLQFAKPQRFSALKKHDRTSHFVPVKFNNGADTYCNKDETRIDGPWTYGSKPFKNNVKGDVAKRNAQLIEKGAEKAVLDGDIRLEQYRNVDAAIEMLKLKLQTPHTAPCDRGYWLWGDSRTGKSTWAREQFPDFYDKPQNKWWDGYKGEKVVILDDFDTHTLGHYLKRWMDVHPCTGESKGKTIQLQHDHFIVTSNLTIEDVFANEPHMIAPIRERCRGRIHHFSKPFDYLKTDRSSLPILNPEKMKKDDEEKMGFE